MTNDLLQRYFEGNVTAIEQEEVLLWVEESDANRKEYFRLRRLYDIALIAEVEKAEQTPLTYSRLKIFRWMGSVAAALLIGISIWTTYWFTGHNGIKSEVEKMQIVEVGIGQQVKLTLPDSTVVLLNSNSKFSYPTSFARKNRTVTLDGEGYFDVSHDAKHPFVVQTSQCNIKVLGTTFNVMAYSTSGSVETTLLEGSVLMKSFDNQYSVTLRPLQMATYTQNKGMTISAVDTSEVISWKKGIITFGNEPLPAVFHCLEQYYGVKFAFDSLKMAECYCTGKFSIDSGIEHIVRVLARSNNFSYEMNNDSTVIRIR